MPRPTFDQLFADVPAPQRETLQRFWADQPYRQCAVNGAPWRYVAMGSGHRLVVLLPHALLPADAWCLVAERLASSCRLLIPDGYVQQRVLDPARATEALAAMIQAEGEYSATFIAHGSGGGPAQWLLHQWPHRVQHLVLCHSPALSPAAPLTYAGARGGLKWFPTTPLGERHVKRLAPNLPASGDWVAFARAYLRLHLLPLNRRWLDQALTVERMTHVLFAPSAASMESWRGRLLFITALDDPFSADSLARYQELYPTAQAALFDAGGHWTPLLFPDLLAARLQRFVLETEP